MLFELIAVLVAGIAGAGVALLARRLVPALPRSLSPLFAGLAMIGVAISLEYSWYGRTAAAMPEGVEVALTHENRAPWRPWTYVAPYVDRFIAVDQRTTRTNEAAPGRRMVDLYVFGRWAPTQRVRSVFDCEAGRRADLAPGVELAEGGELEGATWIETGLDDPVTGVVCAEA